MSPRDFTVFHESLHVIKLAHVRGDSKALDKLARLLALWKGGTEQQRAYLNRQLAQARQGLTSAGPTAAALDKLAAHSRDFWGDFSQTVDHAIWQMANPNTPVLPPLPPPNYGAPPEQDPENAPADQPVQGPADSGPPTDAPDNPPADSFWDSSAWNNSGGGSDSSSGVGDDGSGGYLQDPSLWQRPPVPRRRIPAWFPRTRRPDVGRLHFAAPAAPQHSPRVTIPSRVNRPQVTTWHFRVQRPTVVPQRTKRPPVGTVWHVPSRHRKLHFRRGSRDLPSELQDPAFDTYVGLGDLGRAWDELDPVRLTDVGLQLAEGERVLLRPRQGPLTADRLLELAARLAGERHDRATLERLGRAAERLGDKALTGQVAAAQRLASGSRDLDPAELVSADQIDPQAYQLYRGYLLDIEGAGLLGDRKELQQIAGELPELRALPASQIESLRKLTRSLLANVPAEGEGTAASAGNLALFLNRLGDLSRNRSARG
jgi:hypothetical protein